MSKYTVKVNDWTFRQGLTLIQAASIVESLHNQVTGWSIVSEALPASQKPVKGSAVV